MRNIFFSAIFGFGLLGGNVSLAAVPPLYGSNSDNQFSAMATNVAPFASWSPGWVLADVFPKAIDWTPVACDFSGAPVNNLVKDPQRWVRELAADQCAYSNVFFGQAGHYPAGEYVMLFEGDGTFIAGPGNDEVYYSPDFSSKPVTEVNGLKRVTFSVEEAQQDEFGIGFLILDQELDYIRNIRLIAPGGVCGRSQTELNRFQLCATSRGGEGQCAADEQCYDLEQVYFDRFTDDIEQMESKVVFHPEYVEHYRNFSSIRYMKWGRVEDSPIVSWQQRVTPQEATFTLDERGFPYEYMVAFSNQLNADAYFNIPVLADDEHIRRFGQLVDTQLRDSLDTHIEYGNEFFNSAQAVPYHHALAAANEPNSGIPSSDEDLIKVAKWSSSEAIRTMSLWRDQFQNPDRVSRVLVGFNPRPDYTSTVVAYASVADQAEALAMNGYIGPDRRFADDVVAYDALTLEQLFEEISDGRHLASGASNSDLNNIYLNASALASQYNMALILYEAGQHIVSIGGAQSVIDRNLAANSDPRMGSAYLDNFNNFRAAGGTEIFNFVVEDLWNENGSFGLIEHQNSDVNLSPKYQAVQSFITNNPCWWMGCSK